VLNIGLQAGILTPRVFAMFVLDALFLTFCTTPVVETLYPEHRRIRVGQQSHATGGSEKPDDESRRVQQQRDDGVFPHKTRITVLLDKFDHLPGVMSIAQLLAFSSHLRDFGRSTSSVSDEGSTPSRNERLIMTQPINVTALRLIEVTDRTSSLMKSARAESLAHRDPLLKIFRTVGDLNDAIVSSELSVVPINSFGKATGEIARGKGSDLVVLGWTSSTTHLHHGDEDGLFDHLLKSTTGISDNVAATAAAQVIRSVFKDASTDVALFMDQRGLNPSDSYGHRHIFMPFFGGADDRAGLMLVVQLCLNPRITATVVKIEKGDDEMVVSRVSDESDEKVSQEVVASGYTIHTVSVFLSFWSVY
jgi:hypothetical protein